MESALRPRDIQARIRAGETPDTVATAAQTTVEAIMPYAVPVLAERAHVARTALTCSVRRRTSDTANVARTLGDAARVLFDDVGLTDEDVAWDAWRRDNGQWTLVADYTVGGRARHAEFTYDVRGRYVVADNDEARVLTGETKPAPTAPTAPAAPAAASAGIDADDENPAATPPARRLSVVSDQDELPLGDDAIELVRERPTAAGEGERAGDADDGERTAAGVPDGDEPAQVASDNVDHPFPDTADADWLTDDGDAATAGAHPASDGSREDTDELPLQTTPASLDRDASDDADDAVADQEPEAEPERPRKRPGRKKGRASVPSWDEIMFGGGDQRD